MAKYVLTERTANWLRGKISSRNMNSSAKQSPRPQSQMPMPVIAEITKVYETGVYEVSVPVADGLVFKADPIAVQLNDSLIGDAAYQVGDKILVYPVYVHAIMQSEVE